MLCYAEPPLTVGLLITVPLAPHFWNPRFLPPGFYWKLLKAFAELTGVPVLLNTSFNENEPIVHRPAEALNCFLRTRMDALVLGDYVVEKH